MGIDQKQVEEALEVKRTTQNASLSEQNESENTASLLNLMGAEDSNLENIEMRRDLKEAMRLLDDNQRKIIYYRYFEDLTQSKIADILGVSQMQVSRLEKNALEKIRRKMIIK